MNFSILFLLSSMIFLILSYLTFITKKNKKNKSNSIFFLFTLASFWWHFFNYIMQVVDSYWWITFFAKIEYIGVILVPVLLYHFILKVLDRKNNLILKVLYVLTILFELLLILTNKFIEGFYLYDWGVFPAGGYIHLIFIFFVSTVTIISLRELYNKYKTTKVYEVKKQVIYLSLSIFVFSLAIFDFIPNYGFDVYPVSFISMLVFLGLIFYSITKYNLISSNLFMGKTFVLISLTIITYVLGLIFDIMQMSFLKKMVGVNEMVFLKFIITFIFVYIIVEFYINLTKISKKIFKTFDSEKNISSILIETNNFKNKNDYYNYLLKKISIILKTDSIIIFKNNAKLTLISSLDTDKFNLSESELWKIISFEKDLVIVSEEKLKTFIPNSFKNKMIKVLSDEFIEILTPINQDSYLMLRKKNNGRYAKEEIDFLKKIMKILNNQNI